MRARRGFTLLEVMIGLALLGFGLVVLIKATTGNIRAAKRAQMIGVATDLSRGKMYDIEEKLLKEGFTETDQSEDGKTFDEEGWPEIKYAYKVEQIELPGFDQLQAMARGAGSGSGSARGAGSDALEDGELPPSFQDSALGGVISMVGGGFAGGSEDIESRGGAAFIQTAYQIISEGLKASIRKVTLTVKYDVLGEENELVTVAFFTDAAGMDKGVLNALGGGDVEGAGSAGQPGGTPPGLPTTPRTPTPTPGGPRR
jgi:prepilin-type N-terminal cleavage/methylation domain-containing protein